MNGLLLINKPTNMTSRDVVNKVSRLLGIKKIGHTGTLDPLATGVLVLCIGKATKIASLITNYSKEYFAEVMLGIETDTLDIEGDIIKEKKVDNIAKDQIEKTLKKFIGSIEQEVPKYSAIKVNGKKLYEYARTNEDVELPVRKVNIFELSLIGEPVYKNNKISFKIKCNVSKGTYIRSLIRDIGYKLNTVATMTSLVRTRQGEFKLEDCYNISDIENNNYGIVSLKEALSKFPFVKVDNNLARKISNGSVLNRFFEGEEALIINNNEEVIAIYQTYDRDYDKVKPLIMF